MSTPSKAQKRKRSKNVWPLWLTKKRRPRGSPSANYLHPITKALGRTIKTWRMAHGLTVTAIAGLTKLARGTVYAVERGTSWFSWNAAAQVCDAMGLCIAAAIYEAMRRCGRIPR